jgi:trk system potassium uptake protein TrkA
MQRFAVIGLGRFGQYLARALTDAGDEVIAIDNHTSVVSHMRDEVALAVRLDATDRAALEAQGVGQVSAAVVSIGEQFESTALCVATLKEMGVPRIIARAMTEMQAAILTRIGADAVVLPEQESARRWAHRLSIPKLQEYIELAEGYSMIYLPAPAAFCHKTLAELQLRNRYQVNLVAIRRRDKSESPKARGVEIISVPSPTTQIMPEDTLILVGSNESLSELPRD